MKFHHRWWSILCRAWSMRFIGVSIALSGAEVLIPIFSDEPPIPRGLFAGLAFAVTVGAAVARLLVQRDVPE